MPASQEDPEGWGATDKFTVVLETAGLNSTQLISYRRERDLDPEHVERWRQAYQDANDKQVRTLKEQKELELLHTQDLQEMKQLEEELRLQEKAIGGVGGTVEKDPGLLWRGRGRLNPLEERQRSLQIIEETTRELDLRLGVGRIMLQHWQRMFASDGVDMGKESHRPGKAGDRQILTTSHLTVSS